MNGFIEKYGSTTADSFSSIQSDDDVISRTASPLHALENIIYALTHADNFGRILLSFNVVSQQASINYLLLHPEHQFLDIVTQCRSVILAGGTMQPISDMVMQLFPSAYSRLDIFSCGHIVPPTSILTITVPSGPSGHLLEFTFDKRSQLFLIDELGATLANLCHIIPDGVVAFFQSYGYLSDIINRWRTSGLWERLIKKKQVKSTIPKKSKKGESVISDK